jgi:hypothetical protein
LSEHLLQSIYDTILPKDYAIHYQPTPVPAALRQVNKFVHDETKAELTLQTKEKGITLACSLHNMLYIARILEMITQGLELHTKHHQLNPSANSYGLFNMMTLIPVHVLKSRVS